MCLGSLGEMLDFRIQWICVVKCYTDTHAKRRKLARVEWEKLSELEEKGMSRE